MSEFDMRELIARKKELSRINMALLSENNELKTQLQEINTKIVQTIKDGDIARLYDIVIKMTQKEDVSCSETANNDE